jgi:thiol-disulfide isomerase/thioredoxin
VEHPFADSPQPEETVNPAREAPSRQGRIVICLIAVLLPLARGAAAEEARPAGSAASPRNAKQIAAEIQKVGEEIAPLFSAPQDLLEPGKRQAAAPKAVPALRKMVRLLDEVHAMQPAGAAQGQEKTQLTAMLAAFGDKDAAERLKAMASSAVAGESAAGRSAQLFTAWLLTDGNPAAQQKVVDDLAALASKHPSEPTVAGAAMMLVGTTKPEAKELRQKIAQVVTGTLKGNAAATAARQLEVMDRRLDAQAKLRALEGKPLTLEGSTPAGGRLSTADFKGKVVLIDFWASWCDPCKEELPRLKKAYAQYHAAGLEVVGVSCDNAGEELVAFLSKNKDMPWPQLFDAGQPGWHALAARHNVNSIPTMFLIDRKGIVRSAEARASYEKMIPELLKEPQ